MSRTRKPKRSARKPETWPVIWRVVMPCMDIWNYDMVLFTGDEKAARREFQASRCADYPIRLERVQCGPLPANARENIQQWRKAGPRAKGWPLRLGRIPGYWTARKGRKAVRS